MVHFRTIVQEDIRLSILQALEQDPGYSHNDAVLQQVCEAVGHRISLDRVRTELDWLDEQGLVDLETVGPFKVATISTRGVDVARGRSIVSGVKRPRPGV